MAKFLSLDVGDARIGVAISRSGVISDPLTTINRRGKRQAINEIQAIVEAEGITTIVSGLPRLTSGDEGDQAEKTRAFIRSLQRRLPDLEYHYQDERYTSLEAKEIAGKRVGPDKDKGLIDRLAAALILQAWLDEQSDKKD